LRSLQEFQLDFEEEAKAYAGLWSQGQKKEEEEVFQFSTLFKVQITIKPLKATY
jgi:hypothetical protein